MNLEDLYNNYALNDGEILSINVDFLDFTCSVRLLVRKTINQKVFRKCEIELLFSRVTNIDISEDFRTQGAYSDITLTKNNASNFYLSLDPYCNKNEPQENDNIVVVSHLLKVRFNKDEYFEIS